jgi:hypothetical protein
VKLDVKPMTVGKVAELIAVGGAVWLLLEGADALAGRWAAWSLGLIMLAGVIALFVRRR